MFDFVPNLDSSDEVCSLSTFFNLSISSRDLYVLTPHFAPILETLSCYQFFLSLLNLSIKNIKRKKEKFGYCFKPKLKKL